MFVASLADFSIVPVSLYYGVSECKESYSELFRLAQKYFENQTDVEKNRSLAPNETFHGIFKGDILLSDGITYLENIISEEKKYLGDVLRGACMWHLTSNVKYLINNSSRTESKRAKKGSTKEEKEIAKQQRMVKLNKKEADLQRYYQLIHAKTRESATKAFDLLPPYLKEYLQDRDLSTYVQACYPHRMDINNYSSESFNAAMREGRKIGPVKLLQWMVDYIIKKRNDALKCVSLKEQCGILDRPWNFAKREREYARQATITLVGKHMFHFSVKT